MSHSTEHLSFDVFHGNSGNEYVVYRFVIVYNYFEDITRYDVRQRQSAWKHLKYRIKNHQQ